MFALHELTTAPGRLLQSAEAIRANGHRIGLADVGWNPSSLAIIPLLRPDLVEVNVKTIRRQPDYQSAQTLNAVTTYAEELPALVLATGLCADEDFMFALGFGATLGSGSHASTRAGDRGALAGVNFSTGLRDPDKCSTPFSVASAHMPVRAASRKQLAQTSHFLETCAFDCDEATIVLSSFQKSNNLTPEVVDLYAALSRNLAYVFAFTHPTTGDQLAPSDIPDLRVKTFEPDHPLSLEWNVIILNARFQAMLAARETDRTNEDGPIYEYILTHNRPTILNAARTLTPLL